MLVDALCAAIESFDGRIRLSTPAVRILSNGGGLTSVWMPHGVVLTQAVIGKLMMRLTQPLPRSPLVTSCNCRLRPVN